MNNQLNNNSNKILGCCTSNELVESHEEKKKKINFTQKKDNTICSLFEVEHFLCSFQKIAKTLKLYKILKK